MKLLAFIFFFGLFSTVSFANCLMRVYVDPIFSKDVSLFLAKAAKAKKYKIISASDDRWEHFRLNLASPGITADGVVTEVVSVGLQKFASSNFEFAYQKGLSVGRSNRDQMAMDFLKDIPSCTKAVYADVFSSLED